MAPNPPATSGSEQPAPEGREEVASVDVMEYYRMLASEHLQQLAMAHGQIRSRERRIRVLEERLARYGAEDSGNG